MCVSLWVTETGAESFQGQNVDAESFWSRNHSWLQGSLSTSLFSALNFPSPHPPATRINSSKPAFHHRAMHMLPGYHTPFAPCCHSCPQKKNKSLALGLPAEPIHMTLLKSSRTVREHRSSLGPAGCSDYKVTISPHPALKHCMD